MKLTKQQWNEADYVELDEFRQEDHNRMYGD